MWWRRIKLKPVTIPISTSQAVAGTVGRLW